MVKKFYYVLTLLLLCAQPVLAAGMGDTYGFGSRAIALGGAFTAVADDYSAVYYNPAGLALQDGSSMTMEYNYGSPNIEVKNLYGQDLIIRASDGRIRNNPNEYRGGRDGLDNYAPIIGATFDVNGMVNVSPNIQMGLAISPTQNKKLYNIHSYPPDQPHFVNFGDNSSRVYIVLGLGFELVKDYFYLGAGAESMMFGDGMFYVDELTTTPDPSGQNVIAQMKQTSFMKNCLRGGFIVTPLGDQSLRLAFNYRDKIELVIDPLPTVITMNNDTLGMAMVMGMEAFYSPQEFDFGLAYESDKFMVALDLNYLRWSSYEFSESAQYHYNIANTDLVGLGVSGPDFDDIVNVRLGFEYKLTPSVNLMFGYAYLPTPVPNQSGRITNYLDMDRHVISTGADYSFDVPFLKMDKPFKIAGSLQYQMLDDYTVNNTGVLGKSWRNQESFTVEGDVIAANVAVTVAW